MSDIWREKVNIRFGNVDRSDRLTLGSIFGFFQEAAISHATELGAGRDALAGRGQAWVLSRLSLFVERRPVCGETIEVCSWPRGFERLFAFRDYAIKGTDGKELVRGRGVWLVLDIEKRKPLRIQPIADAMPHNDGIDAFPAGPSDLSRRANLVKLCERRALYSDIDFYGHVNNARYVQWIQDATDIEILTNAGQIRLDINYLSEVMPRETVELWTARFDGDASGENAVSADYPQQPGLAIAYEGRRPGTEQAVFRAELRT
jgi:acyl-ACP thioesterase